MSDDFSIVELMRQRQLHIARIAKAQGVSWKAVALDSDIPYSTLLSYFPGEKNATPAVLPITAVYQLIGVLPDELLSLLLPDGRHIVQAPEEIDHDKLAELAHDFLVTKEKAHHPESPAGRDIADCEDKTLKGKVIRLRSAAA